MSTFFRLAISGNDGAGKSTLARRLCADFGLNPADCIAPFGDFPRHVVAARHRLSLETVYAKPTSPEVRRLLIGLMSDMEAQFGYAKARQCVLRFWLKRHGHKANFAAEDCRFPEELEFLRKRGAIVIHISHPPTATQVGTYYAHIERLAAMADIRTDFETVRTDAGYELLRETVAQLLGVNHAAS